VKLGSVVDLNLNCDMELVLMRLDIARNEIAQERSFEDFRFHADSI